MSSSFLVPDRDQSFLIATSYRDQLGAGHRVWTVIDVVEGLDLTALYDRYSCDTPQGGRPAFDPAMMLTLLVFGYCEGKRSSRELEEACRRDVAYQAICGGMTPDHATIARFRVTIDDVLEDLFIQVLAACAQHGLVGVGRVALDGTKIAAAASKDSNVTAEYLVGLRHDITQILAATTETAATEAATGPATGPAATDTGTGDPDVIADDAASNADAAAGGWSVVRRERETVRKLARVDDTVGAVEAAAQRRAADEKKRGRTKPGSPKANLTDPQSRLQKTREGWIQGYNAQAVVSEHQVVVCAQLTAETTDSGMFSSLIDHTWANLETVGVTDRPQVVLADAGYWSKDNARIEKRLDGTVLLIAPTKSHHVGEKVPDGDLTAASDATLAKIDMQKRLAVVANRDLYRQRAWMIEGSFAHTKIHRRSRRFMRRGIVACAAEWQLINLAGNINKIHNHQSRSRRRQRRCAAAERSQTATRRHTAQWRPPTLTRRHR